MLQAIAKIFRRFVRALVLPVVVLALIFAAPTNAFAAEVRDYVDWVKSATPASGHDAVLVPGQIERQRRADGLINGVELLEGTWAIIVAAAANVDVSVPDPDSDPKNETS